MQYDPCYPEIEEKEMYDEVRRPEMDQSRQKTPMAKPMEIPLLVDGEAGMARFEHRTPKSNEVKLEDIEDWKQQIMVEMPKKIGGYRNPLDLTVMAT